MAESWQLWAVLGGAYAPLTVWAVLHLRASGALSERLRPRGGDLSIGIVAGLALVAGGLVAQRSLMPAGSPNQEWLFRIYAQVGSIQQSGKLLTAVALIVLMEELVWRGLVLDQLSQRFGTRVAAPASALLYAIAHSPSVFTLAGEAAGPNPLLVLAALGCGACWSFAVLHLRRMWPVIVSHMIFTYFMAAPLPAWL
jgi:hypothetical protein